MNDPYAMNTSSMGPANFQKARFEGVQKMMSAASEKVLSKADSERSEIKVPTVKLASEKKSEAKSVKADPEKPVSVVS